MSTSWEVDPETRAKLLEIQKQNGNNSCVDCGAPSPQWASPKLGVFMCLNCSGVHRSLGVHISFIRSVTMDGFKVSELRRMQMGGNKPWQEFFDGHEDNRLNGRTFADCTIKDRYDSEAGREWKDRLTAKVEGTEYVPGQRPATVHAKEASIISGSRSQTPVGRSQSNRSPARIGSHAGDGRKVQNEAYFAKMGAENAARSGNLPPNQGGKFSGFGSEPMPTKSNNSDWLDDFSKDPLSGLTKGFGWLGKSVKTGYDGYIAPNVQKLGESDLAYQARIRAAELGKNIQSGTRTAADSFNKFIEGDESVAAPQSAPRSAIDPEKKDFWESFGAAPQGPSRDKQDFWDSFGQEPQGPPAEKKGFWDDFAAAGTTAPKTSSSVGTAAMKKVNASGKATGRKDEWDEW